MNGRLGLVAGFLILLAPTGVSQEAFPAWVGLYDPSHLGWLENENRLSELCPDASSLADCHSVKLRPAVSILALHVEPNHASPQVGELVTVAVPGRGLSAHFRPVVARDTSPFVPDLFLQDWGYGPYFHHTTSARQGDWFQLPPDPWDQAVWVHRAGEAARSSVIPVQAGDIIELNGSGMYVLTAERDALELRPEQPGDLLVRAR